VQIVVRRAARSPLVLVAVFAFVAVVCATRHELWLDEANPWVIARDARSLPDLWFNMRFEPHPALWYVLLFLLSRFTTNPAAMQVLHVVIATASVAVIAFFAPFRVRDKWLLAFGYYLIFEYGAISRGYALGVLLALLIAALIVRDRATPLRAGLLMAALGNTSAFGLVLSGALAVGLMVGRWASRWRADRLFTAGLIYATGVAFSIYTMWPRPGDVYGRTIHTVLSAERLADTADLFWAAFLPLPDIRATAPWSSNMLLVQPAWPAMDIHRLVALASVGLFAMVLWSLRRSAPAALLFGAGTVAIAALLYVEYSAGYRHHGHFFILFIVALWVAMGSRGGKGAGSVRGNYALTVLLVVQVLAGAYFVYADAIRPFSFAKQVAAYVRALPPRVAVVVAQPEFLSYVGPPLSAYLQKPVYYAFSKGVVKGSYLVYDHVHRRGATDEQIVHDIAEVSDRFGTDVYVVANHWTPVIFGPPVVTFSDHLVPDEQNCAIYLFRSRRHRG